MTDETLERIWLLLGEGEAGTHVWCDDPNPSGNSFNHEAVGYVRTDVVERLTAERDAALADCGHWRKDYNELQRLYLATDELLRARTMERDAALAWYQAVEKAGSALCLTFDLTTPAEEALRDVLTTACGLAEFEAFRAGAEAMRDAASEIAYMDWDGLNAREVRDAIRALPLPAHQSSTQTGTNATNGHS